MAGHWMDMLRMRIFIVRWMATSRQTAQPRNLAMAGWGGTEPGPLFAASHIRSTSPLQRTTLRQHHEPVGSDERELTRDETRATTESILSDASLASSSLTEGMTLTLSNSGGSGGGESLRTIPPPPALSFPTMGEHLEEGDVPSKGCAAPQPPSRHPSLRNAVEEKEINL